MTWKPIDDGVVSVGPFKDIQTAPEAEAVIFVVANMAGAAGIVVKFRENLADPWRDVFMIYPGQSLTFLYRGIVQLSAANNAPNLTCYWSRYRQS